MYCSYEVQVPKKHIFTRKTALKTCLMVTVVPFVMASKRQNKDISYNLTANNNINISM